MREREREREIPSKAWWVVAVGPISFNAAQQKGKEGRKETEEEEEAKRGLHRGSRCKTSFRQSLPPLACFLLDVLERALLSIVERRTGNGVLV